MPTPPRKQQIFAELERVRKKTLWLLGQVPESFWNVRVHDFYSPVGWHFGHIGMTEEFWTCGRALGRPPIDERLCFLFANIPENPRNNRVHLPDVDEVAGYLASTRARAFQALFDADFESDDPLLTDGYAWEFALQHECQHQETVAEMLQLIRLKELEVNSQKSTDTGRMPEGGRQEAGDWSVTGVYRGRSDPARETPMARFHGGICNMGSDDRHGYDNEKRAHAVHVAPFEMDLHPVTAADWLRFMSDGGYERRENWSETGWEWRVQNAVQHPEYWVPGDAGYGCCSVDRVRPIDLREPVTSLSWYEADAYARWAGKRLPTEAEWEFAAAYDPKLGQVRRYPWGDDPAGAEFVDCEMRAWAPRPVDARKGFDTPASCHLSGGAWEWTSSPFLPYPGFEAFPYDGYSKEHMDGNHFVCRGGSWATDRRILRASFRNWYVPTYRQGFLGMRCAR